MSILFRDIFEDNDDPDEDIPLDQIPSKFLGKILEYCQHYDFKKVPNIPKPLPSNDLAQCIPDDYEVQFIKQFTEDEVI